MQIVGFLILATIIYFTTTTIEKNPNLRTFWTIVGCLMFFTGALCLIVNSVGLKIGDSSRLVYSISNDVVNNFKDIFDKPLKDSFLRNFEPFPIIRLKDSAQPKQCTVRPIAKKYHEFSNKKLNELLEAGVVVESTSPWRHNPVVVLKSDGSPRLTINYKPVNNQTIFDAYSFPNIEEIILKLAEARLFSSIDFSQCYHQLPLHSTNMEKQRFQSMANSITTPAVHLAFKMRSLIVVGI